MITIFTLPKPFVGKYDIIQQNAIRSWLAVNPAAEIILFGDEDGTKEVAQKLQLRHEPVLEQNEYGTPIVSYLFERAQHLSRFETICFINADIIVTQSFQSLLEAINFKQFLLVGRRWNLDVEESIDFTKLNWKQALKERVNQNGKLYDHTGIDYFLFKKGLFHSIPPFAIGRTKYDNWLIYKACQKGAEVIDATESFFIVHQNHGYPNHILVKNKLHQDIWVGPEVENNLALAGDMDYCFSLLDAKWILEAGQLKKRKKSFVQFLRYINVQLILHENIKWLSWLIKPALRCRLRLRQMIRKVLRILLFNYQKKVSE